MKFKLISFSVVLFFSVAIKAKNVYLFSYFIANGQDGLHLAYSYDGLKWLALKENQSFLKPEIGKDKLMRDPSIIKGEDGFFHMVWTTGWWDKIIGYASSKDLVNWSDQDSIPAMVHEPTAKNAWAPELFFDQKSKTYYIFWASTIPGRFSEVAESDREKGLNHRMFAVTTNDFKKFSDTFLFFNPDFSVIDASILKVGKENWMFVKNENPNPPQKNIRLTKVKNIKNGFPIKVSEPITGKYWAEGPAPLQVGDYIYVYFDKYRDHKYGAVRSKNGLDWEDVSDQIEFPKGTRHGTAFTVDETVLIDIQNKLKL